MRSAAVWAVLVLAPKVCTAEPIRLHPENPHYFLFRGKPAVLVTSGEHYGAVLNLDFDYKRYLRTLAADRLNLTRTFSGSYREGPDAFRISDNTLAPRDGRFIAPWARTAQGKFDLDRWNDAWFARLKDFLREAASRGIVVELTLFCPFYREEMWDLSPLNARNNVNGVGNYRREEVFRQRDPAMQRVQDAMVRKIVTEVRDFDNLMYEICNEPYSSNMVPAEWERHIAGVIAEVEATFPQGRRHLITQNVSNGSKRVPDPDPHVSVFNFHYSRPPESVALNRDLQRPVGCNETGFDGQADATYRIQGWEFLMAGGALYNNLDYSFTAGREDGTYAYPPRQPGGGSVTLRRQLRVLRDFMDAINFVGMRPSEDFVRSGIPEGGTVRVLAVPGKSYALYLHHGTVRRDQRARYVVDGANRTVQLGVFLPAGRYRVEWIDTKTGRVAKGERFSHEGGLRSLRSPGYSEDIALRVARG